MQKCRSKSIGFRCWWGFLLGIFICSLLCEKVCAEPSRDNKQTEAEEIVRLYYEMRSEGDAQGINRLFEERQEGDMVTLAAKECGVEEYIVLQTDVYPLDQDPDAWLFVVSFELQVKDIETHLPGIEALMVYSADENLYLKTAIDPDDAHIEQIISILNGEEVTNQFAECNRQFNTAVTEDERIWKWVEELQETMAAFTAEDSIEGGDIHQEEVETQYYVVKKGDCLWHIAEQQMGDGRYWRELYERNRKSIGGNPDLIMPGEKLEIPRGGQQK